VSATAPRVVALRGVGVHTTATLLVTAGDNPEPLRSVRAFGRFTGTAPVQPHRASRSPAVGTDRQDNVALHLISPSALREQLSAAFRWWQNAGLRRFPWVGCDVRLFAAFRSPTLPPTARKYSIFGRKRRWTEPTRRSASASE
jgi:hypothetical protein